MYEYGLRLSKSLGALYQNVAETILLSAFSGISWSEYVQLQSCDIHLGARILYIYRPLSLCSLSRLPAVIFFRTFPIVADTG